MRHRRAGRRLGRNSGQRKALFRNLTKELFTHEVIHTTEAKAKSVRPLAEKLITLAKHGVNDNRVHAQRLAMSRLNDPVVVTSGSCSMSWPRAMPAGPAATSASPSSARARAMALRWCRSS